jgi:hypothetical protein
MTALDLVQKVVEQRSIGAPSVITETALLLFGERQQRFPSELLVLWWHTKVVQICLWYEWLGS